MEIYVYVYILMLATNENTASPPTPQNELHSLWTKRFFFPMKIRGYENNSGLLNLYFACINRCTRLEIIIIINPRLEQINVYNVSCSRKQQITKKVCRGSKPEPFD